MKFLRQTMKLEALNGSTDYVARLGTRSGERLILVRALNPIALTVKLEILKTLKT
jgi:hypothetical protein